MRALLLGQGFTIRDDYPDPARARGESIVRVRMAGICGTDLELARGYMSYRGVPGHEFVGEVVDTRTSALAGQRVVGEINAACGRCARCLEGLGRHCPNRTVLGILGRDGAFAEYLRLPDENLIVLPDSISDELGVFVEPMAAIYEIFEQTGLRRDHKIAVLGDGRLGALAALVLRAEDYAAVLAGRHRDKLDRLAALGLEVQLEDRLDPGFDVVVDCTGRSAGLNRALALVRPRGTVILKSTAAAGAPLNLSRAVVDEITIVGSRCGRFAPAIAALASGKVDPRPLVSSVFALDDAPAAFAAAERPPNFKVLLKP
ncbi:MAG TPA: alcohol dehydrogenase catalytic domain-containing protein [Candidatus Binataceae bacterium]|nr:alcohol dehydrogenase catalytic domain-containing protein [Candidatus Binataceae bacterium]